MWCRPFLFLFIVCYTGNLNAKDHKKQSGSPKQQKRQYANSTPGACRKDLWHRTYNPERLQVYDSCKVVTGTIVEMHAEEDGDEHILLRLDKGQSYLLKSRNKEKKDGCLVLEIVCANKIKLHKAIDACSGYLNNVALPQMNQHVKVTGGYALDTHNGWTEIHPVTKVEAIK